MLTHGHLLRHFRAFVSHRHKPMFRVRPLFSDNSFIFCPSTTHHL